MKKLTIVFLLLFVGGIHAQGESLFDQGKERYRVEDYQGAINNWIKIIEQGQHSAAVYHNLGNAHYKLNQIGPSIYYYEKALQLAPGDSDVRNNLAFAQNATVDAIEPLPETVFSKWYKRIAGILSYDGWATAAVILSLLAVILFLVYYFSFSERRKRLFFATSLFTAALLLLAVFMAFRTYSDYITDTPAIIFAESIEVRSEPGMGNEVSFVLHEGTKVQVIAEDEDWARIRLADGKDGWIPETDIKRL